MPKTRIEAFSDGVFAIVITLMALDIRLSPNVNDLMQALQSCLALRAATTGSGTS